MKKGIETKGAAERKGNKFQKGGITLTVLTSDVASK